VRTSGNPVCLDQLDHFADGGGIHHQLVAFHAGWWGLRGLCGVDFGFIHSGMTASALVPPVGRILHRPHVSVLAAGWAKGLRFCIALRAQVERSVGSIRYRDEVVHAEALAACVAVELIAGRAEQIFAGDECARPHFEGRVRAEIISFDSE
jgi:hypothetical protein